MEFRNFVSNFKNRTELLGNSKNSEFQKMSTEKFSKPAIPFRYQVKAENMTNESYIHYLYKYLDLNIGLQWVLSFKQAQGRKR